MKNALVCLVLTVAFATSLSGCAKRAQNTAAPGALNLGMVTDVGGLGDKSFNDSANSGLQQAQSQLGAHVQVLQSKSAADYQPNLSALTNQHYDEIYAIGFLMNKDLEQMAKSNPKQRYAIIDAVVDQPNVTSVTFKEQDGSFMAGALSALMTKTHHVAFLGGVDIPLIRKFEAGYIAGAHQIDPAVKVDVKYVGSFEDVASGKELANLLYGSGVDIIFAAAGKAGLGAMAAVKDRKDDYVIGVDSNQDGIVPGKVLTSMVKRVDVAVMRVAQAAADQKPLSGHITLGLADQGIALTDFQYTKTLIGDAKIARLNAIRAAITSGKITPPATREELDKFKFTRRY
ncbi:MAG: BMP family ABC transporter substrate-binding protein [Candidatus Eremiobacteraeota bacterium]|nr:BMP family ABC transporter substrate-binding protein [Candidatus Eremiobacteraeota bacterium]